MKALRCSPRRADGRWWTRVAAVLAMAPLSACSLLSPVPLWELAKAGGAVANAALDFVPAKATDTVSRGPLALRRVCVESGPTTALPELLPAVQAALAREGVDSRVLPERSVDARCPAWLQVRAEVEWGRAPMADGHQPYLARLDLRLLSVEGHLLAASRYSTEAAMGFGRWTATRAKVAPVVAAVLHGAPADSDAERPAVAAVEGRATAQGVASVGLP